MKTNHTMIILLTFPLLLISFSGCSDSSSSRQTTAENKIIRLLDHKEFVDAAYKLLAPQNYVTDVSLQLLGSDNKNNLHFYRSPRNFLAEFNTLESTRLPELKTDNEVVPLLSSFQELQSVSSGWMVDHLRTVVPGNPLHSNQTFTYTINRPFGVETVTFYFDRSIKNTGLTIEYNGQVIANGEDEDQMTLTLPFGVLPGGRSELILKSGMIKQKTLLRSIQIGSNRTIIVKSNSHLSTSSATTLSFNRSRKDQRKLVEYLKDNSTFLHGENFLSSSITVKPFWAIDLPEAKAVKRGFMMLPGDSISQPLSIPNEGATLYFSLGYDTGEQLDKATLKTTIRNLNDSKKVFVDVTELKHLGRMIWYDKAIDLSEFAGEQVEISFEYGWPEDEAEFVYLCIGEPLLAGNGKQIVGRKNVILISLDTMRADRHSISGHERQTTPYLDSVAGKSFWAKRMYSLTSYTLPAHKTMLTGFNHFYLSYLGGRPQSKSPIPKNIPLLSTYFKEAGYRTFGLCEQGFVSPVWGFDRDFDVYYEFANGFGNLIQSGGKERVFKNLNVEPAVNWLESKKDNQPFFMFVHTYNPHIKYSSLGYESFWQEENPEGEFAPDIRSAKELPKVPGIKKHVNLIYDRNLRRIDDEVRRFLTRLEKNGLLENTIIVITSDHGEMMGHHDMLAEHGNIWEGVLRVPLIIKGADLPDSVSDIRFSLENLTPTILSLAGLEVPDYLAEKVIPNSQGTDHTLLPSYITNGRELLALIKDNYKYIQFEEEELLFDLESDPAEESALDLNDQTFSDIAEQMRYEACLRLGEEVPGWSLFLPNNDQKKLRIKLLNLNRSDLFVSQNADFTMAKTRVTINKTDCEVDSTSLLYCFEPKANTEVQLVIEEWNEAESMWKPFNEEIVFNGSSQVDHAELVLVPDKYDKISIDELLTVSLRHANNLWYTVKPFASGGKINEVSLSDEDLENLKNLGYLQ